jgi:type IV secretory pathway TrbL component
VEETPVWAAWDSPPRSDASSAHTPIVIADVVVVVVVVVVEVVVVVVVVEANVLVLAVILATCVWTSL